MIIISWAPLFQLQTIQPTDWHLVAVVIWAIVRVKVGVRPASRSQRNRHDPVSDPLTLQVVMVWLLVIRRCPPAMRSSKYSLILYSPLQILLGTIMISCHGCPNGCHQHLASLKSIQCFWLVQPCSGLLLFTWICHELKWKRISPIKLKKHTI